MPLFLVLVAVLIGIAAGPAWAQDVQGGEEGQAGDAASSAGGGGPPEGALLLPPDADLWRAVRHGVTGTVAIPDKNAAQLIQAEGETWRDIRNGPLIEYGAYGLLVTVVLLALFYLVRGRVRIDGGASGRTVQRFSHLERVAHWLLAVSFIILALTGLNITFGKYVLLPLIGNPAFATVTQAGKWLHNHAAFAFILGLAMVILLWIRHNLPSRVDLKWIAQGGGILFKGKHPPAKKFNVGQKLIFWLVVLGGLSLVLSGIALLFPFQTGMFAKTFEIINLVGFDLPTNLTALQEMQLATIWHAMVAIFMVMVILAHIYIGTLGMEGAFSAMETGQVDENWAKQHHSLWVEKQPAKAAAARPARTGLVAGLMRAFVLSIGLLVAVTGVAAIALNTVDMSSRTVYSSDDTRH